MSCESCGHKGCDKCGGYASIGFRVPKLRNPIADELRSEQFFESDIFIPYATNNQDVALSYLKFLHKLARLSVTKEACINFIIDSSFKEIEVVGRTEMFGVYSERSLSDQEVSSYLTSLKENIHLYESFQSLAKKMAYTYLVDGNMATVEKISEYEGVFRGSIDFAHTYDYVYLRKYQNSVAYSKDFHTVTSNSGLQTLAEDGKIFIIPSNEGWKEYPGLFMRLRHTKSGTNHYWGRPSSEASIYDQYGEYQNRAYQTTQAKYGFTLRHIMEKEGITEKQERALNEAFNERWINDNGEDVFQSTLLLGKREGASDMKIHDIKPFSDHQYFAETSQRFRENIIISHKLSERLLGISSPNGFSANTFLDEFRIKESTVIKPIQMLIEGHINSSVRGIMQELGQDPMDYHIKFKPAHDTDATGSEG